MEVNNLTSCNPLLVN